MSDNNTLDLTDIAIESNVQVEIVDEEPVETEGPEEVIEPIITTPDPVEEASDSEEEASDPVEEASVSTEEVVQNVQSMLTTDVPASSIKTTEEKLNSLIELLKSIFSQYEIDDDEFVWSYNMLKIRGALNEL